MAKKSAKKTRKKKRESIVFDPEHIELIARNEQHIHESIVHHIRAIRFMVDDAARRAAQANSDWHDDPTADDHADYHRNWQEQYPPASRNTACRSLIDFYLTEFELGNYDPRKV